MIRKRPEATGSDDTIPNMISKVLGVAALSACAAAVVANGVAQADPPNQVTYELTGTAPFADYVSYEVDSGPQAQQVHVPLPWRTQFGVDNSRVLVISAEGAGSITCTIKVNGKVVNQATASGAPARTVCSN